MQDFYAEMHRIVGELMYADNFYIALYDEDRQDDELGPSTSTKSTRTGPIQMPGNQWEPARRAGSPDT